MTLFHPVAAEEKKKRKLAEEELNSSPAEKLPGGTAVAAAVFADMQNVKVRGVKN